MGPEDPSRLRGTLIDHFRNKEQGSLTRELAFGNFGVGIGDLEVDGFAARNSNNSFGQDAFAISADKRTFVVADGLGGSGTFNPAGVSKWSKSVAETVAQLPDIKQILQTEVYSKLVGDLKLKFEGESINLKSKIRGKLIGIRTTLSAVQMVDQYQFDVVTIGDSPVYIIDKATGKIIRQFGEDALTGETDAAMRNMVGLDSDGNVVLPGKKEYITNERIKLNAGELLLIGSDFFSDHTHSGRNLREYIGLNAQGFHAKAASKEAAKVDDATLIIIDPEKLKSQFVSSK